MKKSLSILFSMLLLLSMLLTACAGKDDANSGDKKEVPQNLRINIATEPFSLNPGLANDSTSGGVLLQTFEGLTRIDADGEPQPAMAEEIKTSEDLMTYTFTLRDAKWTNGDPVTAEDFEYAWKWALNPRNESQYAYQLYYLKGANAINEFVEKVAAEKGDINDPKYDQELESLINALGVVAKDDKTLEVTLENPTPYFLELTAFYTYFPVNSKIAKENPNWHTEAGKHYTSNGPFKLVEWKHQEKIVLEKNENYWDEKNVKLENIEMYMINDPNTERSMFDKGEVDWAGSPLGKLPVDALPQLHKDGKLNVKPIAGTYWYKFNTEKPPLNNKNIRKALAYAINRKDIVENVTKGGQIPAMAAVPPSMISENEKGYFKDGDVKKAKQFLEAGLKEMGLKDASELPPIKLSINTDEAHMRIAQAIQDMWKKKLGIDVEIDNAEWKVYIDKLHSGDYQIGRMGWLGDFNDPINFLELYKDKYGGNNDTFWENPEFKALLDQSQKESDPDKRLEMLKDAEKIFIDEMPVAPIYFYTNTWLQAENLKGAVVSGLGEVQFKWAYFE